MPAPRAVPPCRSVPGFNAIILAGGRSSRLGGTPKALFRSSGRTLLDITLTAAAAASTVAVAGPESLAAALGDAGAGALLVREDPPFSGPAAGVAAAWAALAAHDAAHRRIPPEWTLVLACDMPFVSAAVTALLAAAGSDGSAGPAAPGRPVRSLLAVDGSGRAQPLAALYRSADLRDAVEQYDRPAGLENLSMKRLLARVQWRDVAVPAHSTADVDTWDDARRWSVEPGPPQDR
ncbi:NTP transferase domain-containing protein [Arthrobacter sp. ATA002]|uniref:molybdenum cofactor guanylyltransferase n=1 Tax=Arthrobacter sp. ATA002 TaxID=2991715 RepID=UPI0022A7CE4D|nr:NTP transferase domain-containing protein [Arthrobacter sp. ATA002]WAP51582.1 NTP transferase domain-containing protein [Arthrobacter sp. ATA002]